MRPGVDAILRLAARPAESTAFSVSYMPEPDEGWLELLAMGLTFDLSGLTPLGQASVAEPYHLFGLDARADASGTEALRLTPGPHLSGASTMLPVLRVLAGLGAELARLPGLKAVGWEPARSQMAPAYFMSAVRGWLVGGAFPALGLTGLNRLDSGGLESEGLALFTGFEIAVEPLPRETVQDVAKLAARAMHMAVLHGAKGIDDLRDAMGRPVIVDRSADEGLLRLWRRA
ncbi:hypothetical protein [Novosphingobium sp. TH158]|uniref:hypothetical protein n=1 Tax=Novosphingobium sp. TH158 TaxID=2067455 RepID=UPI000C7E12AD|nr:hypothetical protein [Novosphingobium sp. TH158]PLK26005.1 hypothetical protein C0V78_03205 [Novosphingobium sp. TH158]